VLYLHGDDDDGDDEGYDDGDTSVGQAGSTIVGTEEILLEHHHASLRACAIC